MMGCESACFYGVLYFEYKSKEIDVSVMSKTVYIILSVIIFTGCMQEEDFRTDLVYTGDKLRNIYCPMGGTGGTNLFVNGQGQILFTEIPDSFGIYSQMPDKMVFSITVQQEGDEPVKRIMERAFFEEKSREAEISSNPAGGAPRFSEAVFHNAWPVIRIDLVDDTFPLEISMTAWSPFIPGDSLNSSLSFTVIEWTLTNRSKQPADYRLVLTMPAYDESSSGECMKVEVGDLPETSAGERWEGITYKMGADGQKVDNSGDSSAICLLFPYSGISAGTGLTEQVEVDFSGSLIKGGSVELPFLVTWYSRSGGEVGQDEGKGAGNRNRGEKDGDTGFSGIDALTSYVLKNLGMLEEKTSLFSDAMVSSTLPPVVLEAVISGLPHTTVYREAIRMFQNGKPGEGMKIVTDIRSAYDGRHGNPFAGTGPDHSAASALERWSLYQAMAGYQYHERSGVMQFAPVEDVLPVRYFWLASDGWGTIEVSRARILLKCLHGSVSLHELVLKENSFFVLRDFIPSHPTSVTYADRALHITFPEGLILDKGEEFLMALP